MIEIGTVVEAEVSRVEPYGIFLTHKADAIFVPLGEVAWPSDAISLSDFQTGQTIKVLVERLNYKTKTYAGSIRHLHPERNPYRQFSRELPERIYTGTVKMAHHDGVVVDLGNGCEGELPLTDQTRLLPVGSQVNVQITSLEVNDQRMALQLAPVAPESPSPAAE